jgi:hypothetical protein
MCLVMETPAKRADVLYNVKHAFSIIALSPLRHFGEYMYIPCRETATIRRNFFSQEFDWVVYHMWTCMIFLSRLDLLLRGRT